MAVAGYSWPEVFWTVADLEYKCVVCDTKAGDVQSLREHIHGKAHHKTLQNAGVPEDPSLSEMLDYYADQERPFREEAKRLRGEKAHAFIERAKEFEAGLSPEELQLHKAERKRKRSEQVEASGGKQVKFDPYTCPVCKVELMSPTDIHGHLNSKKHKQQAQEFVGGCTLCGVAQSSELMEHFAGKKHMSRVTRLEGHGVDLSQFHSASLGKGAGGAPVAKGGVQRHLKGGLSAGGIVWPSGAPPKVASKGAVLKAKVEAPPKGKFDAFTCGACKVEVNTMEDLTAHMQSQAHAMKAKAFAGGCAVCGVAPGDDKTLEQHFGSKKHTRKVHALQSLRQ